MSDQPLDDALFLVLLVGGLVVVGVISAAQYFGTSYTGLLSQTVAGSIITFQLVFVLGCIFTVGGILGFVFGTAGQGTLYSFVGGGLSAGVATLVEEQLWTLAQNYGCAQDLWSWWTLW